MKDEDIGKLLRTLPRHKASPDFTSRLMNDLPEGPPSVHSWRSAWRRPALALAAAVVLVVALASGLAHWHEAQQERQRAEAARRVEALRNEYEALQRELAELRALAAESQPVVGLGGTEDLDFLMDLRALAREAQQSEVRPVDYRR